MQPLSYKKGGSGGTNLSMSPGNMSFDGMSKYKFGSSSTTNEAKLNSLSSTTSSIERQRKILVKKNKGFLAHPISQIGFEVARIQQMFPDIEEPPEVIKSMFPRSVVYELDYKKKQAELKIQEALRKEREALAEKVKMKMQTTRVDQKQEKEKSGLDNAGEESRQDGQVTAAKHTSYIGTEGRLSGKNEEKYKKYSTNTQPTNQITETEITLTKMEGECHPKKSQGGEGIINMYPNDYMGKSGRKKKERPRVADNYEYGKTDFKGNPCKDFPENKARLTAPWGHLRNQEFMKVGKPFKTEAVRWSECTLPVFNPEEEIKAIQQRLANTPKPKKLFLTYCEKAKLRLI